MPHLPVVAAIPLRSSLLSASLLGKICLVAVCIALVLWGSSVALDDDKPAQKGPQASPANVVQKSLAQGSVGHYAEIAPQSEEDVIELIGRVSEYAESGELFDEPIVIVLHSDEARVFTQRNYARYSTVVDLARQLDADDIIDVKICETWMSKNGLPNAEIPDFIEPVPYGPALIEELIEAGSVRF